MVLDIRSEVKASNYVNFLAWSKPECAFGRVLMAHMYWQLNCGQPTQIRHLATKTCNRISNGKKFFLAQIHAQTFVMHRVWCERRKHDPTYLNHSQWPSDPVSDMGHEWLVIIIIIIIMKEFIVHLLQCGHEHRCITLSIKLESVVK